jgi:hypothetical protein
MIIKRKEGYYVIGRTSKTHLGGPYKKREDAERRLLQVGNVKRSGK